MKKYSKNRYKIALNRTIPGSYWGKGGEGHPPPLRVVGAKTNSFYFAHMTCERLCRKNQSSNSILSGPSGNTPLEVD